MRKIFVSMLLSIALPALVATGAHTKEVKLSGIHTQDQVRAACKAVGGVSYGGYGGYGCINKSKGTQVTCTPGGQCTGDVPGRTNPGTPTIMGVIAGSAKPIHGAVVPAGGILSGPGEFAAQGPAATGSPLGGAPAGSSVPRGGTIY
jgi:hypothetical protein